MATTEAEVPVEVAPDVEKAETVEVTPDVQKAETVEEVETVVEVPPESVAEEGTPAAAPSDDQFFVLVDVVLRFLLFAAAVVVAVVLATGNQAPAEFQNIPTLIFFIAAYSVAGLYSIITYFLSLYAIFKPGFYPEVLSQFVIFDVVLLGIISAATGAASTIGYISLKGNSHLGWNEVSSIYGVFSSHIWASIGVSVFASVVLTALVLVAVISLLKKVPK